MMTASFFRKDSSPCASCPYRRDVPLMYWVREEYEKLAASERNQIGILFVCHKYRNRPHGEHQACAGWLLDQRERGTPSIALRLQCITTPEARVALETVHDGGHEIYGSTEDLCTVNLAAFNVADSLSSELPTFGEEDRR